MDKEILDFTITKEKLLSFLEDKDNAVMVLATSADNIVMSRNILVINDELNLYFFTWKFSRKCEQIRKNPKISLCKDKIEIEGNAEFLGLMTADKNKKILEILKQKQPDAIESWLEKPNMILVRIKPLFACVDGYFVGKNAYLEYIDFEKKCAYKVEWASH